MSVFYAEYYTRETNNFSSHITNMRLLNDINFNKSHIVIGDHQYLLNSKNDFKCYQIKSQHCNINIYRLPESFSLSTFSENLIQTHRHQQMSSLTSMSYD